MFLTSCHDLCPCPPKTCGLREPRRPQTSTPPPRRTLNHRRRRRRRLLQMSGARWRSTRSRQSHQTPQQEHLRRRRRRRLRMPGARVPSPQSLQTHQMTHQMPQQHLLRDRRGRHRCQPRMVLVQKHAHALTVERSFSPVDFFALPRHRVGHSQQDWGVGGGRREDYRTQARQEPK